jgi:hypothetical protein
VLPTSVIGDAVPAEVVAVAAPDREYGADFVTSTGSATITSRGQLRPTTPMPAVDPGSTSRRRTSPPLREANWAIDRPATAPSTRPQP